MVAEKKMGISPKNNYYSASAEKFVERLLTEGSEVGCDDSNPSFNIDDRPPFYDEALFRKGQRFFHKHLFSMLSCKLLGLLSVLAIPSILKLLMFTGMSGDPFSSYRRYMATIFHMMVWYEEEFRPGSKSWKSIRTVRNMHNYASKSGRKAGLGMISQKDMALTQFGFMGFVLTRAETLGIHNATQDEMRAFVHVWRVIGHVMGIEERFNLCNGTVDETRQICDLLIVKVFRPLVDEKDKDFLAMCKHFTEGLWAFEGTIYYEPAMCGLHSILQDDYEIVKYTYMEMNAVKRFYLSLAPRVYSLMRYDAIRITINYFKIGTLWIAQHMPLLAYCKFGVKDAIVDINV